MNSLPTPVVRLPSCLLRPYHASDLEPLRAVADDPAIGRYMRDAFPVPYTRDDALFWLRYCRTPGLPEDENDSKTTDEPASATPELHLAVTLHDGTFVGGIGLRRISPDGTDRHTREIGYWIARAHWGRGLASEAVAGLARWALAVPPADGQPLLRRIEAAVFQGNTASMHVLERAGFVREGVRRQAIVKRGQVLDVVMFGLVQADLVCLSELLY